MDNFVEAVRVLTLDYMQEQTPKINAIEPLGKEITDIADKLNKLDVTSEHDMYMYAFYAESIGKLLPILLKNMVDLLNYDAQFLVKLQATFALNELNDIMNEHQIKLDEDEDDHED